MDVPFIIIYRFYFNPRSREGSDKFYRKTAKLKIISIHAPARGATLMINENALSLIFQSTLPRGERRSAWHTFNAVGNFNPRSREGSDSTFLKMRTLVLISIHAPARGATTTNIHSTTAFNISIHAPARGATGSLTAPQKAMLISIHAPARGATLTAFY